MGLADDIRAKMDRGELPVHRPEKVWVGFGDTQPCSGCQELIFPIQVRYGLDLEPTTLCFHIGCYGLWDAELRRRGCYPS